MGGWHWQGSLSDRTLIAENRCAAIFVSTVSPKLGSALQRVRVESHARTFIAAEHLDTTWAVSLILVGALSLAIILANEHYGRGGRWLPGSWLGLGKTLPHFAKWLIGSDPQCIILLG